MRTHHLVALAAFATTTSAVVAHAGPNPPATHHQQQPQQQPSPKQQGPVTTDAHHVDLVIALDTSSSMDGLIDGAREKLWDVVNLLARAKPQPVLRVGLISYGNDGYDAKTGWVRKESDLTTDLDAVYSKLFGLKTWGGSEYVARAVHDATRDMQWTTDPKALRIVFVAGNEPANQDPEIPVERAVSEARQKGIFVNTIYCGSESAGEAVGWQQVATLGHGRFAAIDQNRVVAVATPVDSELARLSSALNQTYIGYGAGGAAHATVQAAQDHNAAATSAPAAAARAVAKSSALYRNESWDLVDAAKSGKAKVSALKAAELPAPMQAMKPAEREAFVEQKAKERAALQGRITELAGKRDAYLKAERSRRAASGAKDIHDALDDAIRTEATAQGFAF